MIIYGWKTKRHPIGLFKAGCHKCNAMTEHVRILQKTVAHVYWIPLIPLRSKKFVVCGGCRLEKPDLAGLDQVPIEGTWGATPEATVTPAPASGPSPP